MLAYDPRLGDYQVAVLNKSDTALLISPIRSCLGESPVRAITSRVMCDWSAYPAANDKWARFLAGEHSWLASQRSRCSRRIRCNFFGPYPIASSKWRRIWRSLSPESPLSPSSDVDGCVAIQAAASITKSLHALSASSRALITSTIAASFADSFRLALTSSHGAAR